MSRSNGSWPNPIQQRQDSFETIAKRPSMNCCLRPSLRLKLPMHLPWAERQGKIAFGQAGILWADIMSTPPHLEQSGSLVPRAITVSSAMRVGVYDGLYVAPAEREACELLTADAKLIKNLQPHFPFILPLSSLP
jgi:hypothetical protein